MIEIQTARFFHAHSFDLVRTDIMKIGSYPPGPLFNIHNKRFFASPKNTNIHTHTQRMHEQSGKMSEYI